MKNQIVTKLMGNKYIGPVLGGLAKFYISNESLILTTGTIGFSLATTAVTLKNAEKISITLNSARDALAQCNTREEKSSVYRLFLKEMAPLILPIVIFQSATIGCAILNKKRSDKLEMKLAETAGALTIAQTAISQYQNFQKEASEVLGEEKYVELHDEIGAAKEYDGTRWANIAQQGAPGEQLFIDMYTGKPFWCTFDRIDNAAKELSRMIGPNGTADVATVDDFHGLIGNKDLTDHSSLLTERMGYTSRSDGRTGVTVHYTDSHYIFPNGTRIQCSEVYLYPEPACIDFDK